jgi:hypothetical protein
MSRDEKEEHLAYETQLLTIYGGISVVRSLKNLIMPGYEKEKVLGCKILTSSL